MRSEVARARGFRTVYGDASDIRTMRIAQVGIASDVIVCVGDPGGRDVVQIARRLAPSARIRAGTSSPENRSALIAAGADTVIVTSDIAGKLLAYSLHA